MSLASLYNTLSQFCAARSIIDDPGEENQKLGRSPFRGQEVRVLFGSHCFVFNICVGGDDCDDHDSENDNGSDGDFDADDADDSLCDIFYLRYVLQNYDDYGDDDANNLYHDGEISFVRTICLRVLHKMMMMMMMVMMMVGLKFLS